MRRPYSASSVILGLLSEELADGAPHVFLRGQMARADRQPGRFQLVEDLRELRIARPEGGDAARLEVARVVDLVRDLAEPGARVLPVLGGVLAVGRVEEVDVVAPRVVARLHDLEGELRHAGSDRAAAGGCLEKLAFLEFPGLREV